MEDAPINLLGWWKVATAILLEATRGRKVANLLAAMVASDDNVSMV